MVKFSRLISFLALASISTAAQAKSIDESAAKKAGANFLMSVGIPGVSDVSDLTTAYVASDVIGGVTINEYYVFTVNGGNSFVMISADDRIIPILAYSDESSFDYNKISPETKAWIGEYKYQIRSAIEQNATAAAGTAERWDELATPASRAAARTTAVTPLLTTLWDQYPGYNNQCPNGSGGRAVTGCVATAMAQVMKFWNWPTVGCGSHTYTPSTSSTYGYSSQTADFGKTAYNWAGMPNSGSSAANSANVQLLMYHAGVAVDMQYGPSTSASGSGSYVTSVDVPMFGGFVPYINCAEYAMKTYFHYKRSLHGVERDNSSGTPIITDPTWISMIEAELNAGRPVIYSGDETGGGGHCWVCDGWQAGTSTFHFNFGWSGYGNGYYSINNVNPGAGGAGGGVGVFNLFQSVIIGIQPDTYPSATGNLKMLSHLDNTTNSPMQYMTGFSVTAKILNSGTTTFNGDFCAQVFDTLNVLQGTIQTLTGKTITAGDSSAVLTFTTTGVVGAIPETYFYVQIMYRPTGTSTWTAVANNNSFINYNAFDMRNSWLYSANLAMELYDSIHVGSHTFTSGQPLNVTTKIANYGTSSFSGTISAVLTNINTGTSYTVQARTGQGLGAGTIGTYTFSKSAMTLPGGNYVLSIQHQPGGAGTIYTTGSDFYENPVYLRVIGGVGVNTVNIANNIIVYPNPAKDKVDVDYEGTRVDNISIIDMAGRQLRTITPDASQTRVTFSVSDLPAGMYLVLLRSGDELITKKLVVTK